MTSRHESLALLAVLAAGVSAGTPSAHAGGHAIGHCRTSQVRLRAGAYGEAATQFTQTLTFRSTSPRRCELAGWPVIRVRDARGRTGAVKILRVVQGPPGAPPFRRVVLRPGGAASFDVYGADWDAGSDRPCPKTSALVVRPPGNRAPLRLRIRLPDCGRLYVAPLIPGRRDRLSWSRVWNG